MAGGGSDDEATSFDLTALLDILSNIIFFLMASFGAAVVAMVPATVPTVSEDGENDVEEEGDKVTVTMELSANGSVVLRAANAQLLPEELKPYEASIKGKAVEKTIDEKKVKVATVDAQAINDHLWKIKNDFRKSKSLIVVPDKRVKYALLIEAMDAARERKMEVEGKEVFPELFPAVVVGGKAGAK